MNDYIPDPVERGESRAESAFYELEQPDGRFRCYQCNTIFDAQKEGGTLSPDPYAMPVCGKCLFEEFGSRCDHCGRWAKHCDCDTKESLGISPL